MVQFFFFNLIRVKLNFVGECYWSYTFEVGVAGPCMCPLDCTFIKRPKSKFLSTDDSVIYSSSTSSSSSTESPNCEVYVINVERSDEHLSGSKFTTVGKEVCAIKIKVH